MKKIRVAVAGIGNCARLRGSGREVVPHQARQQYGFAERNNLLSQVSSGKLGSCSECGGDFRKADDYLQVSIQRQF